MVRRKIGMETVATIVFGGLFFMLSLQMVFFNRVFAYNSLLQVALVVAFSAVLFGVLFFLKKSGADAVLIKHRRRVLVLCVVLLFIAQSIFSYQTYQTLDHDIGKVFNGAVLYVNNPEHPDYYQYEAYINHWSNNAGIFVLFVGLVNVLNFFGLDAYYQAAVLLGQLFFSGAVVFTYLYLEKAYNAWAAVISLFCWFCFPVVYFQAAAFYTDTYSLMFVPLTLYLLHLARQAQTWPKRLLISALCGLSLFCGVQMKATVLFVVLAAFIEALLRKERLPHLVSVAGVLLAVVLLFGAAANVIKHDIVLDEAQMEATDTPTIFWVMMGLSSESGEFNADDENAVRPLPTQAEKKAYCYEVIESRLADKGVLGTLDFLITKASRTFGSGDADIDYMMSRGPLHPENAVYEFILPTGRFYTMFNNVNQAVYVLLNVLMVLGAVLSIKGKKRPITAVYIALCGFFVFMLMWESNHRQIVNQWPLYFMAASVGVQSLYDRIKVKQKIEAKNKNNGEISENSKL